MKLTLKKIQKITALISMVFIPIMTLNQSLHAQNEYTLSPKFTHSLAALTVCSIAKYGISFLKNSSNFIKPLTPLQHPPTLELNMPLQQFAEYNTNPIKNNGQSVISQDQPTLKIDMGSALTKTINSWTAPFINQYNDAKNNTIDCINENIASANTTIANLNNGIKMTGTIIIAVATIAALYGIYKHYKQVTTYKPIRDILFQMYTLLTNQPNHATTAITLQTLVSSLSNYLPKQLRCNLQGDLTLLADATVRADTKITIIRRILEQYKL